MILIGLNRRHPICCCFSFQFPSTLKKSFRTLLDSIDLRIYFSKKVSGLFSSNGSFAHITVTRFSESDRLIILWVYPGSI